MMNDRPIDNPTLQKALDEVKQTMRRYGFAGCVMLVSPTEAAYGYSMHAPWSAIRYDGTTPLGFRFRAQSQVDGEEVAHRRIEGAMHTICQLSDFGEQTTMWMEDLKLMLRRAGIEFDHTPFGGRVLEHLVLGEPPPPTDG
jgi:hypothetical protein